MVVVIIIVDRTYIAGKDISEKIYEIEVGILEEVVSQYKTEIPTWTEISGTEEDATTPYGKIKSRVPNYLTCEPKVCRIMESDCEPEYLPLDGRNVYVQSTVVMDKNEIGEDKVVKMFCWFK
jgi:hypothetical protein